MIGYHSLWAVLGKLARESGHHGIDGGIGPQGAEQRKHGGAVLLTYAIYRKDPVFILGQSMGSVIYLRNLWLIRQKRLSGENP